MTKTELAWAAGFFDGEGCTSTRSNYRKLYIRLCLPQAEKGTLERFQSAVGHGTIGGPYYSGGRTRPIWQWAIGSEEGCRSVMALLWPYLSEPKKTQWLTKIAAVEKSSKGWERVSYPRRPNGWHHTDETRQKMSEIKRARDRRRQKVT